MNAVSNDRENNSRRWSEVRPDLPRTQLKSWSERDQTYPFLLNLVTTAAASLYEIHTKEPIMLKRPDAKLRKKLAEVPNTLAVRLCLENDQVRFMLSPYGSDADVTNVRMFLGGQMTEEDFFAKYVIH